MTLVYIHMWISKKLNKMPQHYSSYALTDGWQMDGQSWPPVAYEYIAMTVNTLEYQDTTRAMTDTTGNFKRPKQ